MICRAKFVEDPDAAFPTFFGFGVRCVSTVVHVPSSLRTFLSIWPREPHRISWDADGGSAESFPDSGSGSASLVRGFRSVSYGASTSRILGRGRGRGLDAFDGISDSLRICTLAERSRVEALDVCAAGALFIGFARGFVDFDVVEARLDMLISESLSSMIE